jgi:hypothetical protein
VDDSFNNGLLQSGLINILFEAQNPNTAFSTMIKVSSNEAGYYLHSLKKLENIDNQLILTNLIKVRASAPNVHLTLMNELKSNTQVLLEKIDNELLK